MTIAWLVLGCLLLALSIVVIARLDATALGAWSTRLLGIGVVCAGYYGTLSWLRFGHRRSQPLHWYFPRYVVPILAGLGALYCLWRVAQNWRAELHGLLRTLLSLAALLLLGALAWLCLIQ